MKTNEPKEYLYQTVNIDFDQLIEDNPDRIETGKGEIVLDCPLCKENNLNGFKKLYIKSNRSVGYCQRCKSKFFPIRKDPGTKLLDEFKLPVFEFHNDIEPDYKLDKVNMDYYFMSKEESEPGVEYLKKRNPYLVKLYKLLGFRFRKDKVVMPFYWFKEPFYYQIRSTLPRNSFSYFCPPIDNKPIWICPLNQNKPEVVLTEGIFGAIGAWLKYKGQRDVISVQGSYLSKYQLWMLKNFSYNKYYIYFDEDDISKHIIETMKSSDSFLYQSTEIIHSDFGDPEDDFLGRTVDH